MEREGLHFQTIWRSETSSNAGPALMFFGIDGHALSFRRVRADRLVSLELAIALM